MKIKWQGKEISGTPEEIIKYLREHISWTKISSNKKYLEQVRKRIFQIYEIDITAKNCREFLIHLKNLNEIDIIEDEEYI
jgi:hypothetical protein